MTWTTEIPTKPTRLGYGEGLVELGRRNPNVVVLGADITSSTNAGMFLEKYPERFFSIGIAEQDMVGVAAGLSLVGKVPFVCTYGVFASGRCWDQIRTTVCYSDLNVKIGGAHGGISVGPDGATHQALEEISIMRCLPGMTVVAPCDVIETRKATIAIGEMHGPAYIRFGREAVPTITEESTPFKLGKAEIFRKGSDVTVIACGVMVHEAIETAEKLQKEGISVRVVNLHTIKPIDVEMIVKSAEETGAIVTAEEHQIYGGMGSAVVEVLAQHAPVPVEMVAVKDRFGESGQPLELMVEFGLTHDEIYNSIKKVLSRKKG